MSVENQKRQYETAVELYHGGKWQDALKLLDDLARDRPDSRHILYYRALCMAGLGRIEDANDRLIELSSFKDPSSKDLAARLTTKIKPQLKNLYKKQATELALMNMPLESDDHYEEKETPRRSWARIAIIIALAIPCLLVAGFIAKAVQVQSDASMEETAVAAPGVPDQFMDVTTYLPARLDKPVEFLMCMSPAGGVTQRRDTELNNQAGAALVANWTEIRLNLQKTLKMAGTGGEKLGGVLHSEMMHTLILPRQGVLVSGDLQGREFETFKPGVAVTLPSIISVCGQPDRNEMWTAASQSAGIHGKTYWWRNVGVAVDSAENITHVLIRAYPEEVTS